MAEVQSIKKMIITPPNDDNANYQVTIYIEGKGGAPDGQAELSGPDLEVILGTPELGDALVTQFPKIDLEVTE